MSLEAGVPLKKRVSVNASFTVARHALATAGMRAISMRMSSMTSSTSRDLLYPNTDEPAWALEATLNSRRFRLHRWSDDIVDNIDADSRHLVAVDQKPP